MATQFPMARSVYEKEFLVHLTRRVIGGAVS
jgi:hypothetical protein